jgi:hypothetical protein
MGKYWNGSPFPREAALGIVTAMLSLRHRMFFQPKNSIGKTTHVDFPPPFPHLHINWNM